VRNTIKNLIANVSHPGDSEQGKMRSLTTWATCSVLQINVL